MRGRAWRGAHKTEIPGTPPHFAQEADLSALAKKWRGLAGARASRAGREGKGRGPLALLSPFAGGEGGGGSGGTRLRGRPMIRWRRAVSPRGAGEASPEGGVSAGFPEDAATLQRPRVSPGDWVGAKGLLDETAIGVLLDEGYPEHLSLSNAKIALGSLTCAFALIAHFFPKAAARLLATRQSTCSGSAWLPWA